MENFSNKASFTVFVIALTLVFLHYSKRADNNTSATSYESLLKPIQFTEKTFPEFNQTRNDLAFNYTQLWGLQELYAKSSKLCLENMKDQHPNNHVNEQNNYSYFGIKVGTDPWFETTAAYEQYATNICYSFSGSEMENIFADSLQKDLSDNDIKALLEQLATAKGQDMITAHKKANDKLLETISLRQRKAIARETERYNKRLLEIQSRAIENQ